MQRVGVIGCGLMGAGIAEVCARSGCDVIVVEASETMAAKGKRRVTASLDRSRAAGRLTELEVAAANERLRYASSLAELADREMIIEAASEDRALKVEILASLGAIVPSHAVIASNTSSLAIGSLASVTADPGRVVGLHFFSPVPAMPLVEVIAARLTRPAVVDECRSFVTDVLGKRAITAPDRPGFIVNALLVPYLLSAIRLIDLGVGTVADVDAGMVLGAGHPMGPLAVADFIGLDTLLQVADVLYAEFKDLSYAAPPLLRRMVEARDLGRKSGVGFHDYS